ncbi:MAG: ERMES complex subunit mmm1 [Cirrosporium novae-zelandiae]|nr:MAG: ERMES complex subunit mmm1 [Cirrosporium novae-zelandiae]
MSTSQGQLSIVLILGAFIKFFIFGDPPNPDQIADLRATARRQRTLAHKRSLSLHLGTQSPHKNSLRKKASSILRNTPSLSIESILSKTYYNVDSHQPESLDWFNVLVAQMIAQFRNDAQEGDVILSSLTSALNGPHKPPFVGDIKVTEISLGEDFPIFSNCRIIPVDEEGFQTTQAKGDGTRLQARMDVDLSDFITLGVETKLILNYPRPLVAVLPVALAVSVVRFSGTLSISFVSSSKSTDDGRPTPMTLAFSFLDDYRLDFSVRSLVGSRSRLQDVPKIAQLVESRLHAWFDDRCVEPRFQQVRLPNIWPRKKNTRGRGNSEHAELDPQIKRELREEARREIEEENRLERERLEMEGLRWRRGQGSQATLSIPGSLPGESI